MGELDNPPDLPADSLMESASVDVRWLASPSSAIRSCSSWRSFRKVMSLTNSALAVRIQIHTASTTLQAHNYMIKLSFDQSNQLSQWSHLLFLTLTCSALDEAGVSPELLMTTPLYLFLNPSQSSLIDINAGYVRKKSWAKVSGEKRKKKAKFHNCTHTYMHMLLPHLLKPCTSIAHHY